MSHVSVLVKEWLHFLEGRPIRYFIDATLGAGGHAKALLQEHPEIERLLGMDQDPEAMVIAFEALKPFSHQVVTVQGNFARLDKFAPLIGVEKVDGILMDLGVSSMQLDRGERGFSFMKQGPLDMRMSPENPLTAEIVVNEWPERELARIFRDYGEEKRWRGAAHAIGQARKEQRLENTHQLVEVLRPVFASAPKKGIHPMTLVFQALRICVNGELEVLEKALPQAIDLLAPGGILAVISFHSLEDRLVKNAFQWAASDKVETSGLSGLFLDKDPIIKILTRKPIIASDEEIALNPRSRSAKLRVVQKI